MKTIILQSTTLANWYQLLNEAQGKSTINLTEDLESYLAFLLIRFTKNTTLTDQTIAIEFLNQSLTQHPSSCDHLQQLGDKCLLFSGLFPDWFEQKLGQTQYLIDIGQSAYDQLAHYYTAENRDLFTTLCAEFMPMVDVLKTLRNLDGNEMHSSIWLN